MFAYQQTLDVLELKKDKGADYICKSKGVCNFKLKPLYAAFWLRIGLKLYKDT